MADTMFAANEISFQAGTGMKEQVVRKVEKIIFYQQWNENKGIITFIVTICADGMAIPPAVILKGKS